MVYISNLLQKYIFYRLMSNLKKIENIIEEDCAAINNNKILKAHYLLKQPNIFILIRWPAYRPGLQYGILKKDFNIIDFVLEGI